MVRNQYKFLEFNMNWKVNANFEESILTAKIQYEFPKINLNR